MLINIMFFFLFSTAGVERLFPCSWCNCISRRCLWHSTLSRKQKRAVVSFGWWTAFALSHSNPEAASEDQLRAYFELHSTTGKVCYSILYLLLILNIHLILFTGQNPPIWPFFSALGIVHVLSPQTSRLRRRFSLVSSVYWLISSSRGGE